MTERTAHDLIKKYIELRDNITKLTEQFEKKCAPYKQGMQDIESVLAIEINRLDGQSIRTKAGTALLVTSVVGLVAILGAAGAGSSFAQDGADGASLGMAIATAVAMLCYTVNLVILPHGKRQG